MSWDSYKDQMSRPVEVIRIKRIDTDLRPVKVLEQWLSYSNYHIVSHVVVSLGNGVAGA